MIHVTELYLYRDGVLGDDEEGEGAVEDEDGRSGLWNVAAETLRDVENGELCLEAAYNA